MVIGGGDTALEDALFLTRFVNKVTIVHRRDKLRATKILQERALANKKIEFCLNSVAVEIIGKDKCEAVKVRDIVTAKENTLKAEGLFIFVGIAPNSEIVKDVVKTDEKGYIISDDEMRTSVDGIFGEAGRPAVLRGAGGLSGSAKRPRSKRAAWRRKRKTYVKWPRACLRCASSTP